MLQVYRYQEKEILVVDDGVDVLAVLESEIEDARTNCDVQRATAYEEAVKYPGLNTDDLVIPDIMGVTGFDLLELAAKKELKVAMLTPTS